MTCTRMHWSAMTQNMMARTTKQQFRKHAKGGSSSEVKAGQPTGSARMSLRSCNGAQTLPAFAENTKNTHNEGRIQHGSKYDGNESAGNSRYAYRQSSCCQKFQRRRASRVYIFPKKKKKEKGSTGGNSCYSFIFCVSEFLMTLTGCN